MSEKGGGPAQSQMSEPVAWMSRKATEVPGTLRTYHSITSHKILPDDIPLYASSYAMGVADAARAVGAYADTITNMRDASIADECADIVRALSSPPSVSDLERENAMLLVGNARYEYVRRLNAAQFAELYRRNITEGVPFDDLIDAARKESA